MGENLILGCLTMVVCLAIECVIVAVLLNLLLALEARGMIRPSLVMASSVLVGSMMIMLVGILLQVTLWAWLFTAFGEFGDFATAFYHSVVNFSTLGYGDLVMSEQRRLLGALEAINGVFMFGLTTGFLFAVLRELSRRGVEARLGRPADATGVSQ